MSDVQPTDPTPAPSEADWDELDQTWTKLPPEANVTSDLIVWVQSWRDNLDISVDDLVQGLTPQLVSAIVRIEARVIAAEAAVKDLQKQNAALKEALDKK